MFNIFIISLLPFLTFSDNTTTPNITDQVPGPLRKCRDRDRLTGSAEEDFFSLVDVSLGKTIVLECHFCKEEDDKEPKIWYRQKELYNSTPEEVVLDMQTNTSLSRVRVNIKHDLVIKNTTIKDSGLYLCEGAEGQDSEYKFNYYLDFVSDQNVSEETGDEEIWRKYHDDNFYPVNKLFRSSSSAEFVRLREGMGLTVEIYTEWDLWSPCDACGKPVGKGLTNRYGRCRIKIVPIDKKASIVKARNEREKNLIYMERISCSSLLFLQEYPYIGNMTSKLPNFKEIKFCKGPCKVDTSVSGWKSGKTKSFKYRKSYVLVQGSHLTIVCPESTLENTIIWRRNGKVLPAGDSVPPLKSEDEPHITVDTFGTLYLREVTSNEDGNYTCQVDDIRMQQVKIFVISKSKLLTQALIRHLIYLGFVLSLTVSCYCAGLCVVWRNKENFKTYQQLKKEQAKKNRLLTGRGLYTEDEADQEEPFVEKK